MTILLCEYYAVLKIFSGICYINPSFFGFAFNYVCVNINLESYTNNKDIKMTEQQTHQPNSAKDQIRQTRIQKLADLADKGINPYPYVFNKDADEHKTELQNLILPNIEICIPQEIEVLDKDLYFSIIDKIEICKNIVKEYKGQINNKVNNLYTPIIDCKFNLVTNLEELNILLDSL